MIKHVILWQLKDELSEERKVEVKQAVKEQLEALVGQVPGLVYVKVAIDPMSSSNTDIYLDSAVDDEAALDVYQNHPAHVAVKNDLIVPNAKTRLCMDYAE